MTVLSLEQRAKLLAYVKDIEIWKAHHQKPKSIVLTPPDAEPNSNKLGQLPSSEVDSVPTQSLYVSDNGNTDHILHTLAFERLLAVNSNVYQDQPLKETPYSDRPIEVPHTQRYDALSPAVDRISYRQPLMPVQSNIASGKQAYSMNPMPKAASLAAMHLQRHAHQRYWNEYTRQASTYLPYNVEMRPYHPALTVNHQAFTTHQQLGEYSLFGQAQTTQVFSQRLPAFEQPAQTMDTLHRLTIQRSLVAAAESHNWRCQLLACTMRNWTKSAILISLFILVSIGREVRRTLSLTAMKTRAIIEMGNQWLQAKGFRGHRNHALIYRNLHRLSSVPMLNTTCQSIKNFQTKTNGLISVQPSMSGKASVRLLNRSQGWLRLINLSFLYLLQVRFSSRHLLHPCSVFTTSSIPDNSHEFLLRPQWQKPRPPSYGRRNIILLTRCTLRATRRSGNSLIMTRNLKLRRREDV